MRAKIDLHVDDNESVINLKSDRVQMIESSSGDYNTLTNKPSINENELIGNKSLDELGITPDGIGVSRISNMELNELLV